MSCSKNTRAHNPSSQPLLNCCPCLSPQFLFLTYHKYLERMVISTSAIQKTSITKHPVPHPARRTCRYNKYHFHVENMFQFSYTSPKRSRWITNCNADLVVQPHSTFRRQRKGVTTRLIHRRCEHLPLVCRPLSFPFQLKQDRSTLNLLTRI